jgi:hypothetical protein
LLAVWCQIIVAATIVLASPATRADQLGGSVPICHADADDPVLPAHDPLSHPTHDCALCAICTAHVLSLAIVSPPPTLPDRHSVGAAQLHIAQPRAPPVRLFDAAQPRGPPPLI